MDFLQSFKALGLAAAAGVALLLIAIVAIGPIANVNHNLRVDSTSESLGCTASGTSCTITLTLDHEHFNTTHLTVTETVPGAVDRTATSTLDSRGRQDITITGLVDTTVYTFTVAYERQGVAISNDLEDMLRLFPVVVLGAAVLGVFLLVGGGIIVALRRSK